MNLTVENKKRIRQIMLGMKCPRGFACHQSSFDNLCKADIFPELQVVVCLEPRNNCSFAMKSDSWTFCQCPLRKYIAAHFGK